MVEKISCGFAHSLVLTTDGIVYGFGYDRFGQIGCDIKLNQNIPIKVKSKTKFIEIATDFLAIFRSQNQRKAYVMFGANVVLKSFRFREKPNISQFMTFFSIIQNTKSDISDKPMLFDNKSITNDITDSILSLFNNQKYSDIQFKVENSIFCHKLILKTRCNYFDSMLSED